MNRPYNRANGAFHVTILVTAGEGQITDFFSYTSLEITKNHIQKSQNHKKSHTESTKNHKSLKTY